MINTIRQFFECLFLIAMGGLILFMVASEPYLGPFIFMIVIFSFPIWLIATAFTIISLFKSIYNKFILKEKRKTSIRICTWIFIALIGLAFCIKAMRIYELEYNPRHLIVAKELDSDHWRGYTVLLFEKDGTIRTKSSYSGEIDPFQFIDEERIIGHYTITEDTILSDIYNRLIITNDSIKWAEQESYNFRYEIVSDKRTK